MKFLILALILIATPAAAQQMAQRVPIEQQREQFKRDCRRMAEDIPEAKRAAWLASCRKEAP